LIALLALLAGRAGRAVPPVESTRGPVPERTELAPLVVAASRMSERADEVPLAVDLFSGERLRQSPGSTVDAVLRESAAFSLFRRTGSLVANPTAQGVSLRGLGPSGASRSLVLLDGVPLNDPFGGWVAWGKVPRGALAGAEIVRGGGSGVWGSAAIGGTVALRAAESFDSGGSVSAAAGNFGLRVAEAALVRRVTGGAVRLDAVHTESDGTFVIRPGQRGLIDRPLDLRQRLAQATWSRELGAARRLTVAARTFREERGNGTPLQRNATREEAASVRLTSGEETGDGWTALAYAQRQRFESVFTAVNAARTAETLANDQFDVPAKAAGGSFTWRQAGPGGGATVAGADVRWVEGETREDFLANAGRLTRRRIAGGAQTVVGLFARHDLPLSGWGRFSAALRADRWELRDGRRREFDLGGGTVFRDDRFADRHGIEISPRIGWTARLAPRLRGRAAAYRAFRVPTLNEYHRPFRVGNVSTEANPALRPETVVGAEAGLEWTGGVWQVSLGGFTNRFEDAVANVTLSRTPTLVTRQRRNLDRLAVQGLELGGRWTVTDRLTVRADLLASDARVREASDQPALVGRRLAQVPRVAATAGVSLKAGRAWAVDVSARSVGSQFEDDENALTLAGATTLDFRVSGRFGRAVEWFAAGENVGEATVEAGRSADGLVSYDAPRRLRAGLTVEW
jgi:outer membrane receptor protein involved in Fe transport